MAGVKQMKIPEYGPDGRIVAHLNVGQFAFGDELWPGLAKLVEECGEVTQVVGKLMMTHGSPVHWSGDLRAMLVEELGDLAAAVRFVAEHCLTSAEHGELALRIEAKQTKFEQWHEHFELPPPKDPSPIRPEDQSEGTRPGEGK